MEAPPIPGPTTTMRVAYLLSRYPAVSHTFFLHEVLVLRARGMHIETASINMHDRSIEELPELEAIWSGDAVPVVVVSGEHATLLEQALHNAPWPVLTKPIRPAELRAEMFAIFASTTAAVS